VSRLTRVFTLVDPANPLRHVDPFVDYPLPFDALWARAEVMATAHTTARVAAIDDLLALKELSGRPRDQADIVALREIRRRRQRT
jgi:hypothetical protein